MVGGGSVPDALSINPTPVERKKALNPFGNLVGRGAFDRLSARFAINDRFALKSPNAPPRRAEVRSPSVKPFGPPITSVRRSFGGPHGNSHTFRCDGGGACRRHLCSDIDDAVVSVHPLQSGT